MPSQLEVEAVIRDAATPVLKQIGQEIDNLVKKANEGNKGFAGLDTSLQGIAKTLSGSAASVAAGMVAVTKTLDDFAVSQLRVRNMAADFGTSVVNIQNTMTQMKLAGIDVNTGMGQMGGLLDKVAGVGAYLTSDEFYKALVKTNPVVANQVLQLASVGKNWEAATLLQKVYMNSSAEAQKYIRDTTHTTHSFWLAQNEDLKNHIARWPELDASEEKYHGQLVDLKTASENVWGAIAHHIIDSITPAENSVAKYEEWSKKAAGFATHEIDETIKTAKELYRIGNEIKDFFSQGAFKQTPEGKFVKPEGEEFPLGPAIRKKLGDIFSPDSEETVPFRGKQGDTPQPLKGLLDKKRKDDSTDKDISNTEKDSNKLLRDMRDLLQKLEPEQPAGFGPPSSSPGPSSTDSGPPTSAPPSSSQTTPTGVPHMTAAAPIPFLGEGAIITKPTLAVVGESGPEAVIPLPRGRPSTAPSASSSAAKNWEMWNKFFKAAEKTYGPVLGTPESAGNSPHGNWGGEEFGTSLHDHLKKLETDMEDKSRERRGLEKIRPYYDNPIWGGQGSHYDPYTGEPLGKDVRENRNRDFTSTMDRNLSGSRRNGINGIINARVDFSDINKDIYRPDAFKHVKLNRSPQAPLAGGHVEVFNRYTME